MTTSLNEAKRAHLAYLDSDGMENHVTVKVIRVNSTAFSAKDGLEAGHVGYHATARQTLSHGPFMAIPTDGCLADEQAFPGSGVSLTLTVSYGVTTKQPNTLARRRKRRTMANVTGDGAATGLTVACQAVTNVTTMDGERDDTTLDAFSYHHNAKILEATTLLVDIATVKANYSKSGTITVANDGGKTDTDMDNETD